MYGNEKVCFVTFGNLCPLIQLHKDILVAGIDDFYIRICLGDHVSELFCNAQYKMLFTCR